MQKKRLLDMYNLKDIDNLFKKGNSSDTIFVSQNSTPNKELPATIVAGNNDGYEQPVFNYDEIRQYFDESEFDLDISTSAYSGVEEDIEVYMQYFLKDDITKPCATITVATITWGFGPFVEPYSLAIHPRDVLEHFSPAVKGYKTGVWEEMIGLFCGLDINEYDNTDYAQFLEDCPALDPQNVVFFGTSLLPYSGQAPRYGVGIDGVTEESWHPDDAQNAYDEYQQYYRAAVNEYGIFVYPSKRTGDGIKAIPEEYRSCRIDNAVFRLNDYAFPPNIDASRLGDLFKYTPYANGKLSSPGIGYQAKSWTESSDDYVWDIVAQDINSAYNSNIFQVSTNFVESGYLMTSYDMTSWLNFWSAIPNELKCHNYQYVQSKIIN